MENGPLVVWSDPSKLLLEIEEQAPFRHQLILEKDPAVFTSPWRRGRDSNPRYPVKGTTVFETAPIDHSGTSPQSVAGEAGTDGPPLPKGGGAYPRVGGPATGRAFTARQKR